MTKQEIKKEAKNMILRLKSVRGGKFVGKELDLTKLTLVAEYQMVDNEGKPMKNSRGEDIAPFPALVDANGQCAVSLENLIAIFGQNDEEKSDLVKTLRPLIEDPEAFCEELMSHDKLKIIETMELPNRFNPGTNRTIALWDWE